ncbi:MAG TPA: MlaD family protein [Solirubrobacteraceae bacterium]|nr:MlaD family protein [Solirubrobacteraceae bacterium]
MSRWWRRRDETPVVELQRYRPVRTGVIALIVIAIVTYFGFTKAIPFKEGFRLHAVFGSALNIHAKSPVRIAGVDVGKVTGIKREGNTGVVTMEINKSGLPIHTDATVKIRPRIFLEGNWFVELQPGSPSAPSFSSGGTIPITHTSDPVQLDQVLNALNTDTRANLQTFLIEYGAGLTDKPTPEQEAAQDPEVRKLNAAQGLNRAYQRGPKALRAGAVLNQAITGTDPHDLSKLIAGIGKVTAALNVHEQQLGELIGNFNTFFASFAAQSAPLRTTVAELPFVLGNIDRGLASLDASFAPTRVFAHDILPGVKLTPSVVTVAVPWIEQVQDSLEPEELGGVASGLAKALPSLAKLQGEQIPLFHATDLFNKCLTKLIYPAGNTVIQDGSATSGVENYKEFWYAFTGLAGIGATFDGNGPAAKFLVGNSGQTLRSAPVGIVGANVRPGLRLLAKAPLAPQGTRPKFPGAEPEYKPLVPCYTQTLPDFNGPLAQGPADGSG